MKTLVILVSLFAASLAQRSSSSDSSSSDSSASSWTPISASSSLSESEDSSTEDSSTVDSSTVDSSTVDSSTEDSSSEDSSSEDSSSEDSSTVDSSTVEDSDSDSTSDSDSSSVDAYLSESSSSELYGQPSKKKCFQCAYSAPQTIYEEVKVPRVITKKVKVKDEYGGHRFKVLQKTVYDVTKVPKTSKGGWDKCIGPFTNDEADYFGIDQWDCDNNCYMRKSKNGDIFRGCYGGEFGVNQNKLGCHKQAGALWCFCDTNLCNKMGWAVDP